MNPDLSKIIEAIFWAAITLGTGGILSYFVGRKWLLGLFESESEPSARIILACIVEVFTLFMQGAGRISEGMANSNHIMAATLLGLGTTKIIATRFAQRPVAPAAPTNIVADTAPVTTQTTNVSTPADASSPQA